MDEKRVERGQPLETWRAQFGPEDTASATWVQWKSVGLLAYVKTDPCGMDRVTGLRANDTAYDVLIEVDSMRQPTRLFYALSPEACAKLGLELSIEEQKAFRAMHCSAEAPSLTIANGSVSTPEGKVTLGETFEQWKKQWGTPDSFSFGVAAWPKWGLDINYSINACGEKRVTAISVYYQKTEDADVPVTRMPVQLESCVFRFDHSLMGDTLNCGHLPGEKPLLLIADDGPKPSDMFSLGGSAKGSEQRKNFAESGKCGSIPNLWGP